MKALIIVVLTLIVLAVVVVFCALKAGSDADDMMESYFNDSKNFTEDYRIRFTKTPEEYYGDKS